MASGLQGTATNTLQGEDVLGMLEAAAQEQAQALAQRTQQTGEAAQQAQGQYQQAAQAPQEVPNDFVQNLFSNLASVVSQQPSYRENQQQVAAQHKADLLKKRADNLQALHDIYGQKAEEAQRAGDLETTEKYRVKREALHDKLELVKTNADRAERMAEAKLRAQAEDTAVNLSGPALDMAARKYLQTGDLPAMGMGKTATAARQRLMNRAAELEPSANLAGNQADFRADRASLANLTKLTDAATSWEKTAVKNSDIMIKAMAKIPDTGVPWLNTPIRLVNTKGLGSADLAAFRVARQVVIPEFARLLASPTAGGVLSDAARKEVESVVRGDATMGQMISTIDVLKQDASNRNQSYRDQIDAIKTRLSGNPAAAADTTAAPPETPTIKTTGKLVKMLDENNVPRWIDAAEVPDAIKQGHWKRAPGK